MGKMPFLSHFKQEVPFIEFTEEYDGIEYDAVRQANVDRDGALAWCARTRRRPTSAYTAGHRIKAGYTRSGKWRPSKWIPGKTDKRAGK